MMQSDSLDEYLDLKMFVARYPQFKIGQMRWLIVKKNENGLAPAISRIGRRLYIHVPSFLKWIQCVKTLSLEE